MSDKENRIRANILKTITLALTMAVTGNAAANTKTSEKDNNRQDPKLEQTDNGVSKSKLSHEKSDTKFIGTDEWGSEIYEKSDGSIVIRCRSSSSCTLQKTQKSLSRGKQQTGEFSFNHVYHLK